MNWKESFYDRINTYTYITNKVVIKSILNINKNNILQIKLLQNVKYQLKTYEFISNKVVKRHKFSEHLFLINFNISNKNSLADNLLDCFIFVILGTLF